MLESGKILVLIGPMGCGKTTVGKLLAEKLGWKFEDGDDFHPAENVKKMAAGIPLTDKDRLPWLHILNKRMKTSLSRNESGIVACSALRESYRQALGIDQKTIISIFLKGTPELLRERINNRIHPFMDNNLLSSQLEALETPQSGITVDISAPPEEIVKTILKKIKDNERGQKIKR